MDGYHPKWAVCENCRTIMFNTVVEKERHRDTCRKLIFLPARHHGGWSLLWWALILAAAIVGTFVRF